MPIERCPTFRDQPPGSTATYNGKCYIFYNQQPSNFKGALEFCDSRGGSLVDESNPALQGFLSWELWRRHKGDANGQYWLGAMRDREDPKNWKWVTGNPVTVSFWNLPGGNDDCARFDGTKGWLWSDTNCGLKLNFICQHSEYIISILFKHESLDTILGGDVQYVTMSKEICQQSLVKIRCHNFTPYYHCYPKTQTNLIKNMSCHLSQLTHLGNLA